MKLELIKSNEKGKTYQADGFKILYRHKDTISGDNDTNVRELIYLVKGEAQVTIKNKTETFEAPASFKIPEKTFHKIKAKSDIAFILIEE